MIERPLHCRGSGSSASFCQQRIRVCQLSPKLWDTCAVLCPSARPVKPCSVSSFICCHCLESSYTGNLCFWSQLVAGIDTPRPSGSSAFIYQTRISIHQRAPKCQGPVAVLCSSSVLWRWGAVSGSIPWHCLDSSKTSDLCIRSRFAVRSYLLTIPGRTCCRIIPCNLWFRTVPCSLWCRTVLCCLWFSTFSCSLSCRTDPCSLWCRTVYVVCDVEKSHVVCDGEQ